MPQAEAMETAKEVLRQITVSLLDLDLGRRTLRGDRVHHRLGADPHQAAAETAKITGAETEVKGYTSNTIPTKQYKPIVEEKTQVLEKDVNTAWRALYDRQANLLTWPEGVQERFQSWGRKYPEKVKPDKIELAKVEYIEAYPAYVTAVYKHSTRSITRPAKAWLPPRRKPSCSCR